jgi:hypothetical protein
MGPQAQMYEFVAGLLNMVASGPFWATFGPIIILFMIVKFLRWAYSATSGEKDVEGLADAIDYRATRLNSRIRGQAPPDPRGRAGARYRR